MATDPSGRAKSKRWVAFQYELDCSSLQQRLFAQCIGWFMDTIETRTSCDLNSAPVTTHPPTQEACVVMTAVMCGYVAVHRTGCCDFDANLSLTGPSPHPLPCNVSTVEISDMSAMHRQPGHNSQSQVTALSVLDVRTRSKPRRSDQKFYLLEWPG